MREVKKEGPIEIGHQGGWREGAAGRGKCLVVESGTRTVLKEG